MNMHISQSLPTLDTEDYQDRTPVSATRDAQFLINPSHPVYAVANRQLSTEIPTQFVGNF